jgi:hypothetical protein
MPKSRKKRKPPKRVLALPDLDVTPLPSAYSQPSAAIGSRRTARRAGT